MNAKDLRTDSALGGHNNDGSTKYAQSGNSLQNNSKSYQDIGANPLAKVDVQTSRPCAIIEPDRILPSPNCNDGFAKKIISDSWPCSDNIYRQPPEYPHKISEYQPPRNISPRQTFQENMQRIMVTPYNSTKKVDEPNFPVDRNVAMLKNVKVNLPSEAKYCDVPYTIGPACNEQKNLRVAEIPVANLNPGIPRNGPHGWPPNNVNIRPLRPYGAPELYQYSEYPSCAGPRPMPMIRPHRTVQEDPSRLYPEQYYQDPNVRFRPYPSKGRYPPGRYEYISNYPNSFHPPFPPHAFDPQKSAPPHSYPLYPQVPIKYIDRRMGEPIMDAYQRPSPQANVAYRNQIFHPSYGTLQPNCIQNNMFPYPSDSSKSVMPNKLPYTNNNKLYLDYETSQNKKITVSDSVYSNDANHTNSMKGEIVYPNYPPVNMHGISQLPLYRKENVPMKNFDYVPHIRNLDPSANFHNPLLRHPIHFSPNAVAISPSDSNTSNDTAQTHATQEDCGYVSQSSTASGRSLDSHMNGFPSDHTYRSPDYRYGYLPRNVTAQVPNNSKNSKVKKDLNVRQFLQMWNEGDDEPSEQNKEETLPKGDELKNLQTHHDNANKQEQLYVLGLVNVPSEELAKYDHIQKISKLPENIKGYNNIELLNQFEEAIESTNMRQFNLKPQKEYHAPLKSTLAKQPMSIPRPVSPLDVEAKISQSVIHKEVGCNFEIKPCSPKMLNVEIATPIQNILDERIIEKVSNPIALKPNVLHKNDKTNIERSFPKAQHLNCENTSKDIIASCSMDNLQFRNDNSLDPGKQNYNLQQYLEYSSVCLSSLPRLDNDIELNFPEINQQFINANNMESVTSPTPVKDLPILDSDQKDGSNIKNEIEKSTKLSHFSPNTETENNVSKLSKYRKLRKSDLESKESQLSPLTKTQFRTDSVIIKNPDMNKNHENDCNIIRDCNADNEQITKKPDLVLNDSITSPHTLQDETSMKCLIKTNLDQEQCNILPKINNEVDQSNLPPDIAIDFSLNKSNNESMKDCSLKEHTSVNDSLLNLINEEMNISEAFDKADLSTNTSYNISSEIESCNHSDDKTNLQLLNDLGVEEFSDKILPSQSDVTETHDEKCDTPQSQNELLYNSERINLSISTEAVDSILDTDLNKNDINLEEKHNNTQDSISKEDSETITSISCRAEESDCIDKNQYSDHTKENYLSLDNDFESNIFYHDMSEKQQDDVQIVDSNLMVPMNATITPEADRSNNNDTSKVEFEVPPSTSEEPKFESDVMSLDVQSCSKNENNKCSEHLNVSMPLSSKDFYFNKRLYSRIIQNLLIRNEETELKENKSILQESIINLNNEDNVVDTNSIPIKDDINNLTLPISVKLEEVSEHSICPDSNNTEDISVHKNDTNIFVSSPETNNTISMNDKSYSGGNDDLKSICSSTIDTMPVCADNAPENEKLSGSELVDSSIKDNRVENVNTDYVSTNKKDAESLNLVPTEESCNTGEEKQTSCNLEEEIISKPEVSIDRRLRLKRSLSDSALNMYTNDDIKPMNTENIYSIPKKRKKINPCEMMEPHLIAQNLCDIIQTNRRNSISTLYDEENVSFCILIDNSCVITEDSEEAQKICLAEISEDDFENKFENDCAFATEGIIFTNEITNNETCSVSEDVETDTKIDTESDSIGDMNDFVQEDPVDKHREGKTIDEESWIEDVACVETVFSDNIAENIVLDAPYSPSDSVLDFEMEEKNESLIYNDTENMEKIKYIYGNEMCTDDAELVETLYRTPQMDVTKTLIRSESQYSDENNRYYDNDSLEKVLSESNDRSEYESDIKCYNTKNNSPDTLKSATEHDRDSLNSKSPIENVVNNKGDFIDSDSEDNLVQSLENSVCQPTQYDTVHSCESTCDSAITYHHKDESPRYSSSPEVSSTTSEEKSCGILLKITKCNGSISSQINEFSTKSTNKISSKLSENNELVNYPRTRPLLTKAAQKYIPPLKETIRHLKVKLPLPQNSLNKLKLLKIAKEKPKSDERHIKSNDLLKHRYPKKNKPKFEDVLKSIDEIQIKMHKEKNKKHKHSIPKVVIKKNENGAHYASTSSDRDAYNPDLTGRKWQPWVFIEKNYFVDKMALNNKVKAIYSYRKNTYVLAEKFRKYKSVNNAKFIITPPNLEDISSGKLKYTIRLNHNY